jgi:hypothetical protein
VPHGWYNLGVAHGVPSVIAFLGLVCAANLATRTARPLLGGAIALCHGAIGAGHIFNRLWQATAEPRLDDAARFWLAQGLAMRRPAGRLGGFHAVVSDGTGQSTRRVAFRGLLMGAAGLGLALLAATTDVEPSWDRLLLLS